MTLKTKREVVRVSGHLKEVTTIKDEKGKLLHKIISPVMFEFYPRDVLQVVVGAAILAVPVGFTEETWKLGATLPWFNIILLFLLSILFISAFVYYNYYRMEHIKEHFDEFIKRVVSTYVVAFIVVSIILTIINIAPWTTDLALAFKRVMIVTFPASMSAAVADVIK